MSGLVRLPSQFGAERYVRPDAVTVVTVKSGSIVDVVVEGVGLYLTAHCADRDHAARVVAELLTSIRGDS